MNDARNSNEAEVTSYPLDSTSTNHVDSPNSSTHAPSRINPKVPQSQVSVHGISPLVAPKSQAYQREKVEKKKRATPALKVLTSRNKSFLPCQSQLSTPATDITPFHSPADPLKLNSDGPNWHLFNKKVADSLDKLSQLTIQDDKSCSISKDCSPKLEFNTEDAKIWTLNHVTLSFGLCLIAILCP